MVATFNISSLGRNYLAHETPDEVTVTRLIFVVVTLILGGFTLMQTIKFYFKLTSGNPKRNPPKRVPFLVNFVFLMFLLNVLIHNAHYADNIYRPAAYFEPKYLYVRYLISTMELTFFANFPISYAGMSAIHSIFVLENNGLVINRLVLITVLLGYCRKKTLRVGRSGLTEWMVKYLNC